ncbi:MAG: hypothetical protein ACOCV2_09745, partial [Persicimonas sp.]
MTETTELRIRRLVRELLTVHVDAFATLLAEGGFSIKEQRRRLDAMVRALDNIEIVDSLQEGGRTVPVALDQSADPPTVRLHRKLIDRVDDDAEILAAFRQPVARLLDISPVTAGLVLQCQDERQLKSLARTVQNGASEERVRLTQVPAIVEQRMKLFEARLAALGEEFGKDISPTLEGREKFCSKLSRARRGWPDWSTVARSTFMKAVIGEIEAHLDGLEGVPEAELWAEFCWESLDLSSQSFLRRAAKRLRARGDELDVADALTRLAAVVDDSGRIKPELSTWSSYADLWKAWEELFREEQRFLAWTPGRRPTPDVSVFEPPIKSLGLSEPDSLPWSAPLLSWSLREQNALRDLLHGLRSSLKEMRSVHFVSPVEVDPDAEEPELNVEAGNAALKIKVIESEHSLPDDFSRLLKRAYNAAHRAMLRQFDRLDASTKQRVLQSLRSAYDGYFQDARQVWSRRFQAWKSWEDRRAFSILSTELRHILGPSYFFDPFETPTT